MSATAVWSTDWSRRRATRQSDLCALSAVRDNVVDIIRQLTIRNIHTDKPAALSLEVVASKRQSAILVERDGTEEAVLLFDVAQSIVLKRLFRAVQTDQPYDDVAAIVAAGAGLAIANESPALCAALLSFRSPQAAEYVHQETEILKHYQVLRGLLPSLLAECSSSFVDGYIIAHEMGHYMMRRPDSLLHRLTSGAKSAFEFGLEQVCYEQRPDFEALATCEGALSISSAGLEQIRHDLAHRRAHYLADKARLVEEITCDAYALIMLTSSHVGEWRPESDDVDEILSGFLRIVRSYYLVVAMSDLHQAMIQRAKLSIAGGVETEKPGDIADMHFRKMALLYSMAELAISCLPEPMRQSAIFPDVLQWVVEDIGAMKNAIDALVAIPVTRVVRAAIVDFEKSNALAATSLVDSLPWQSRLEPLFGHDWPAATFSEAVARALVGAR